MPSKTNEMIWFALLTFCLSCGTTIAFGDGDGNFIFPLSDRSRKIMAAVVCGALVLVAVRMWMQVDSETSNINGSQTQRSSDEQKTKTDNNEEKLEPRFRSFYELSRYETDPATRSMSAMSDVSVQADENEHVRQIQESWTELQSTNVGDVGRSVYDKLVMKNIEVAALFQDTAFEHQTEAFMSMLGQSIEWLTDLGEWHARMTPLAQRHVGYGAKPQHYKHFRLAFLKAMREFQADSWSDAREDAWIWYWGKIMNTLGHAAQSTVSNQTSGLDASQFALHARRIHEVWQIAGENPVEFGQTFYEHLTTNNPEMAKLFASSDLGHQSKRFVTMFNHAVSQMDDAAGFEHAIISLVLKHKAYGVEIQHVDPFGMALKHALENAAGNQWNGSAEEAWTWFWGRIHACFEHGLAQASGDIRAVTAPRTLVNVEELSADEESDLSNARVFQPAFTLRELQQKR